MTIAIYTRGGDYFSDDDRRELSLAAQKHSLNIIFDVKNTADIPCDTDAVISYGGDGTFLHCVAMLGTRRIPIMGINSGRLGFLSSVGRSELDEALKSLSVGDYDIEERLMLSVEGNFPSKPDFPHAFNEFCLQKSEVNMIYVDLLIDGERVATYRSDGLIVSTPTGSTAYSLSAGGPILEPMCGCFVINPIAPHNLTMRPLVVDSSKKITLSCKGKATASLDNRSFNFPDGGTFELSVSPYKVSMIVLPNASFYKTIREKMMWARDIIEK